MKIGILTLHSQTNYGGVLQAFALQEVLRGLGHDVVVVDRWMDECNCTLKGITSSRSLVGWVKFMGRAALGFGDGADYIRHVRTARVLPSLLRLTPYHFCHWKDAPSDLGVDLLVVGSDQVWNPNLQGSELPYLLEGAPKVPAIAYAASFGLSKLPIELADRYQAGFKRFKAISVREQEGVEIVESLGSAATHVLDPTILADPAIWNPWIDRAHVKKRRKLVCYLIQDPLGYAIDHIKGFAAAQNCDVEIFFGAPCTMLPSSLGELIRISTGPIKAYLAPNVHARASATPDEFVNEIGNADMVLTDSFHALMFSTIFRKNIRVLAPRNGRGAAGFLRLSEFCDAYIVGHVIYDDIQAALHSLHIDTPVSYKYDKLVDSIAKSRRWLANQVNPDAGPNSLSLG